MSRPASSSPLGSLHALLGGAAIAAFGLAGCQAGEDIAPTCFSTDQDGDCIEPAAGLRLSVKCSTLPRAIATADYEHKVSHVPLPAGHRSKWKASNLPKGMKIDHGGVLSGRPTKAGTYRDISITLRDLNSNRAVTTKCGTLEVYDAVKIDLAQTKYGCISPIDNINAITSGGTGDPLACELPSLPNASSGCPHGFGNGSMPAGLTVNKDCTISGTIDPSIKQNGTFAWIVEVKQSGATQYVPFCATHKPSIDHNVELVKEGQVVDHLAPLLFEFDPTTSVRVATHDDPRIRITGPCLNKSCIRRGVTVAGTCSPLDYSVTQMLSKVDEIRDKNKEIVGLMHGFDLHSGGQTMPSLELDDRPWIMSLNTRYCTSAKVDQIRACDVPGALESNLTWSVIATPKSE